MSVDEFEFAADLHAEADAPSGSLGLSALTAAAEDGDKADAAFYDGALSSQLRATARPENASKRVDPVPFTLVAAGERASETERLERLRERLVSEHVRSTDELVAYRRQFTELVEERARVLRSIIALEARLEDEELLLLLVAAKLKASPNRPSPSDAAYGTRSRPNRARSTGPR